MPKSTLVLGIVFALLVTLAGLFLLGGTLSAQVEAVTASASDYPAALESIRAIVEGGQAPQYFDEPLPADAAQCQLENVTITLSNRGLIDAEWLSVTVDGAPGDIAVYSISGESDTVAARTLGTLNLKLISLKSGAGSRVYHVEYYVYGMKRTLAVTQDRRQDTQNAKEQ